MIANPIIYPVILSGGSGSRLWPISRKNFPKQLQSFNNGNSLIQETVLRVAVHDNECFQPPIVVCNEEHKFIVAEQLRAIAVEPKAIIVEEEGRDTAPAVALAADLVRGEPNALLLVMPSDHFIRQPNVLRNSVLSAVATAARGYLVLFGIIPEKASTAFGYIRCGSALGENIFGIKSFFEKPNEEAAKEYVESGECYWNSGIFLLGACTFLKELQKWQPKVFSVCNSAMKKAKSDLHFLRPNISDFLKSPSISIDYAVMENTTKGAVVPVKMGWTDIGSWSSVYQESDKDAHGNVLVGDVSVINSYNNYIRSDSKTIAAVGVKDSIIVNTDDAVLITNHSSDQAVKDMVTQLSRAGNMVAINHAKVYRPWGWFRVIYGGDCFKVKTLCLFPKSRISMQKHLYRSEHWVVVKGQAEVILGKQEFTLSENESTFVPAGTMHRLENTSAMPVEMIEVQSGNYIGEDDIIRIDDDYGR